MKAGIHPDYAEATIKCACGASFVTRTTSGDYTVDICSECHPFYTGKQRIVDTAGRVEKFKQKFAKHQAKKAEADERAAARAAKAAAAAAAEEAEG
ncbi:MAG: 50S ribosomal protein L31 [Sandaracinaceae bacterium]